MKLFGVPKFPFATESEIEFLLRPLTLETDDDTAADFSIPNGTIEKLVNIFSRIKDPLTLESLGIVIDRHPSLNIPSDQLPTLFTRIRSELTLRESELAPSPPPDEDAIHKSSLEKLSTNGFYPIDWNDLENQTSANASGAFSTLYKGD